MSWGKSIDVYIYIDLSWGRCEDVQAQRLCRCGGTTILWEVALSSEARTLGATKQDDVGGKAADGELLLDSGRFPGVGFLGCSLFGCFSELFYSLPEFMHFKLFGKTVLVVNIKVGYFFWAIHSASEFRGWVFFLLNPLKDFPTSGRSQHSDSPIQGSGHLVPAP